MVNTFFVKGDPAFRNDPQSLPKNPPDCPILSNWLFENLY